jgi:hypothetical protein
MVEAPVQITDEYVRTYLWEHNLVAIDEGDFRMLKQPTKLLAIPALMEQAGWVRKREWQGLTEGEVADIVESTNLAATYIYFQAIEAKLKLKNGYAEEKNT